MLKDVSGEWKAEHYPNHSRVVAHNAHEPHEGCTGNLIVAEVDSNLEVRISGNLDIRTAIAELIAAAPNLLDACKETLGEMRAYCAEQEFDETSPMKPTFDQLKAAIAKAEGKEAKDV